MLPLLSFLAAAQAACTLPRTVVELDAVLDRAESAWEEGPTAFADATGLTAQVLECVNTPLAATEVARLLRLDGLSAFGRRDAARSAAAFAAARSADPALPLPESMAGQGSPLRAIWETPAGPSATAPLRGASRGRLYINGVPATTVPTTAPFVFQWIDGVSASGAVATAPALPGYPRKANPARDPLLVGAGVAAAAGGVLYGLAWQQHDAATQAKDLTTLDAAESSNHTLVIASASAGSVAVLALTSALLVAKF